MRPTTFIGLCLGLLASGCLADVGSDTCVGARCKNGSGPDAGSAASGCTDPEELSTNLTLRSAADFDALPQGCWALNANLRIESPGITSLAKLGDLIEVNDLELVDTGLTSIDTHKTIKVYGSLLASGNPRLTNLDNLAVKRWDGPTLGDVPFAVDYTIRNNGALTSIAGLKYVTQIDRGLQLSNNAKLASIELPELATVAGAIQITSTAATSISLTNLSSVGRLEIANNAQLGSVSGIAATRIDGDLVVRGNPALTTIGPMSSVTQLGGALVLDDNDALVGVGPLTGALTRITGAVTITNNANLADVGRLGHLASGIGSTVTVTGNPKLSHCLALEIDHCVQSGTVTLLNNLNANNCNCWCGQ